ncbi:MAG: hypothetical protein AAF039_13465 [Bacteroidota bacterium]
MQKIVTLLSFISCIGISTSQVSDFGRDMKNALQIHETASTISHEIHALKAFKNLVIKYPNEWLPSYWTAYMCTQVARLDGKTKNFPKDMSAKELLLEARAYFETSIERKGEMTNNEKSDFLILESFIYGFFQSRVASSQLEKENYGTLKESKYLEAAQNNPKNPLIYVMQGIILIKKENYKDIISGIALLEYAELIFNKTKDRSLSTHWNKDFIKPWQSRAANSLSEISSNFND